MDLKLNLQTSDPLYLQIERFMRLQLENGKLKAGDRLPSTEELARQWGVGIMAVQKAMSRLVADGLVERKPMKGTFVKAVMESTPIAILTRVVLTQEAEYFHRSVVNHIREALGGDGYNGWTCHVYDGLAESPHGFEAMAPSFRRLASDALNCSFRGIIGLSVDLKKLAEAIPVLALPAASLNFSWQAGESDLELDYHQFGKDTVEFVAGEGCRRIVYLRTLDRSPGNLEDLRGIQDADSALGLPEVEVHQLQQALADGPQLEHLAYAKTMQLIEDWQGDRGRWPDAIMVSDDVAMRAVVFALMRKSLEEATFKQPLLVSLANEGIVHPYGLPVARYEVPVSGIAQTLLGILRKRMRGEATPEVPVKISRVRKVGCPTECPWETRSEAK